MDNFKASQQYKPPVPFSSSDFKMSGIASNAKLTEMLVTKFLKNRTALMRERTFGMYRKVTSAASFGLKGDFTPNYRFDNIVQEIFENFITSKGEFREIENSEIISTKMVIKSHLEMITGTSNINIVYMDGMDSSIDAKSSGIKFFIDQYTEKENNSLDFQISNGSIIFKHSGVSISMLISVFFIKNLIEKYRARVVAKLRSEGKKEEDFQYNMKMYVMEEIVAALKFELFDGILAALYKCTFRHSIKTDVLAIYRTIGENYNMFLSQTVVSKDDKEDKYYEKDRKFIQSKLRHVALPKYGFDNLSFNNLNYSTIFDAGISGQSVNPHELMDILEIGKNEVYMFLENVRGTTKKSYEGCIVESSYDTLDKVFKGAKLDMNTIGSSSTVNTLIYLNRIVPLVMASYITTDNNSLMIHNFMDKIKVYLKRTSYKLSTFSLMDSVGLHSNLVYMVLLYNKVYNPLLRTWKIDDLTSKASMKEGS